MNRPNPYATGKPWSPEVLAARNSMPQYHGHVIALDYVADRDVAEQETRWRAWCGSTPRHLWPTWFQGWAQRKKLRGL